MCNRIESDIILKEDGNSHESVAYSINKQSICKKCKLNNAELTLRTKDDYCSTCFLGNSRHKFRATIGKHKIMKLDEKVLVLFEGKSMYVFRYNS